MIAEWRQKIARASLVQVAAALVTLLGAIFRLAVYARNPSLWNDELYVSLNVVTRSFSGLMARLDLDQSAPLGFLWLERLATLGLGVSEYSLRLVPLLCGLAALPLAWYVARRYVSETGALLVTSAISFSSCAIIYSTAVKPYGVDLFVTLLLLFLAARGLRPDVWVLAGSFALLLSMPAMFVLAGIWVQEANNMLRGKSTRGAWVGWFLTGGCWAAVFFCLFAFVYAPVANGSFMTRYWTPASFQAQANLGAVASLILRSTLGAIFGLQVGAGLPAEGGLFPLALFAITSALFIVGLVRAPLLVTVSFVAPLIIALFGKWVFADRLLLYFVPLAALAIACASDWLFSFLRRPQLSMALVLVLMSLPVRYSVWVVRHPEREPLRETVEFALSKMPTASAVYNYHKSAPAWLFYSTNWRAPDVDRIRWFFDSMRRLDNVSVSSEPERTAACRAWRGGWEIIGAPDGVFVSIVGRSTAQPDAGWLENQYAFIRAHARDHLALVGIAFGASGFPDLERRLVAEGAHLQDQWSKSGTRVVFLQLPAKAAVLAALADGSPGVRR